MLSSENYDARFGFWINCSLCKVHYDKWLALYQQKNVH